MNLKTAYYGGRHEKNRVVREEARKENGVKKNRDIYILLLYLLIFYIFAGFCRFEKMRYIWITLDPLSKHYIFYNLTVQNILPLRSC